MIKKLLLVLSLTLAPLTAKAETYTYYEMCWYKQLLSTCKITEVRTPDGFLDKRNIYTTINGTNKTYIVKSWFDKNGFMTWDSDRKYSYTNQYTVAKPPQRVLRESKLPPGHGITAVTKELWVRQISWD